MHMNHSSPIKKDNTGRAFPYKNDENHFVGPALVNGKLWRVSIWVNKSINGRSYLRMQFDNPDEWQEGN